MRSETAGLTLPGGGCDPGCRFFAKGTRCGAGSPYAPVQADPGAAHTECRRKAQVTFTADFSPDYGAPALPLALPFAVQLHGHGECWPATYRPAGVSKNTATAFNGRSSPSGAFVDQSR
jgi:hypothetical protein